MSMTKIERIEVGAGGAASIVFEGIPDTYTDLMVLVSGRCTATDRNATIAFNTGGTYTRRTLLADGSSPSSDTSAIDFRISRSADTSSTFGNTSIYIANYLSSANKSYSVESVTEHNSTTAYQQMTAGLWNQTAAVSSITLDTVSGDFAEYSSATLYGITAGSDGTTTVS